MSHFQKSPDRKLHKNADSTRADQVRIVLRGAQTVAAKRARPITLPTVASVSRSTNSGE